jgi:acyl dehydratase
MPLVEELAGPPRLGPLYRRAVLRSALNGWTTRGSPAGGSAAAILPAGSSAAGDSELVLREVAVDRAHLARYDRVCGFRLRDELPPTYPHILAFPVLMALMARPSFPLPLLGLVHIANRIELLRPIVPDDRLTFRVRAEDLRPHDRGTQVDVVATALVDDEPVWRGRSTYLRRTKTDPQPGGDTRREVATATAAESAPTTPRPESTAAPEESTTAREESTTAREEWPAPSASWRVERQVGRDYAAVSGDRNPIHTSRLLARAFGFARPIAHGMWSKARCLAALEGRLPDAYTVEVAFKLPILLPATVALSTSDAVSTANPKPSGARFALHDQKSGRPHLTGTISPHRT